MVIVHVTVGRACKLMSHAAPVFKIVAARAAQAMVLCLTAALVTASANLD